MEILSKSFVDETGNLFFDVSIQDEDTLIEKRISVKDYLYLFQDNLREKEKLVKIPKLNENVIEAWCSTNNEDTFRAMYLYNAQKRPFCIAGQMFRLPFPTLLMDLLIVKGTKRCLRIFALDTDNPTDDSYIYEYPFGNVDEDGSVCMGNIVVGNVEGINKADSVFDDFINSVTNEHLYRCQNTMKMTQGELVTYIKNMDSYPIKLLKPIENKTLGELKKEEVAELLFR